MDLRILSVERMVVLSAKWLQEPQRKILESYPETAALINKIIEAHESLFVLTNKASEVSLEVKVISEKQKILDVRHDDLVAAIHGLLTALARRAIDSMLREQYLSLRDLLFPDGLAVMKLSYAEEGGAAILLERRLKDHHKAQLKMLLLPGDVSRTLLDDVNELMTQAKTLLALDDQKKALLAAVSEELTPADELKAKNLWIRITRGIETNLEIAGASPETVQEILGPTYRAAAEAERKVTPVEPTPPTAQ
jgi:hypothetical protein